jgi:hypothetical protein
LTPSTSREARERRQGGGTCPGLRRTAGLDDRGALVPGQRADLIAVTGDVHQQSVRFTLLAEESRAAERPPATGCLTAI